MTTAMSAAQPQAQQHVLKCPDCDFVCLSNNQMCRHIYLTCHTLVPCTQCSVRLVCWGFAPGVKKLFEKGRKDGVLLEDFQLDTAEKHFEATQHQNVAVLPKDAFTLPGKPEMYGLQAVAARPADAGDAAAVRFRCPDCANAISTWTQMTRHLDATKHSLARCAECNLPLKCYGPAQPQRHEKMTGHRGMIGIFRQKFDYTVTSTGISPANDGRCHTPQYRCFCGISFLHPLHLAEHLENAHHAEPFPPSTCQECGFEGPTATMIQHMAQNETHTDVDIPELNEDDYLVQIPRCRFALDNCAPCGGSGDGAAGAAVPNPAATQPAAVPDAYRILYQCPDCFIIFTSWVRLEEHLIHSKHGLCFCVDCKKYLKARTRDDHTAITGHKNVVRAHWSRRDFEVLVNMEDRELARQIEPEQLDHQALADSRVVYQCPVPSCRAVCLTLAQLEEHISTSRHGCMSCPECFADVTVLDLGGVAGHAHPLSYPEHLAHITCSDDLLVVTTEKAIAEHFAHTYAECTVCHKAVARSALKRHTNSAQCVAAAAPLDVLAWSGEVSSPPLSGPGSMQTSSQNGSILANLQHRGGDSVPAAAEGAVAGGLLPPPPPPPLSASLSEAGPPPYAAFGNGVPAFHATAVAMPQSDGKQNASFPWTSPQPAPVPDAMLQLSPSNGQRITSQQQQQQYFVVATPSLLPQYAWNPSPAPQ